MTVTAPPTIRILYRGDHNIAALVLVASVLFSGVVVFLGTGPAVVHHVAGLYLLIILPVLLVNAKINWPAGIKIHESLLYSLALVLLGLLVGGLAINQVLPLLGVVRPLDRIPVVVTALITLVGLGLWRPRRWRWQDGLSVENRTDIPESVGWRDQLLVVSGPILIVGSVAGPIRLNNGAGGSATTLMLIFAAAMVVAVFSWRRSLRESTILLSVYVVSLALLLMTSMRGWFVTGHDIQREFRTFELASSQGIWKMAAWPGEAYYACLSITTLPTLIQRVTRIPDLYVYRTVFQFIFALCPVLIYLIARRFTSRSIAILAVVYFIAFPAYFTDMPFLNRQEIALFFLGVALLFITNHGVPVRIRQIGFVVFGSGVILSHYSTTYVLLGVLILSRIIPSFANLARKVAPMRTTGRHSRIRLADTNTASPRVISWIIITSLALLTFVWCGPITHTGGVAEHTFRSTIDSLRGDGGSRSSDSAYSIFGGVKTSPEKQLNDYKNAAIESTSPGREEKGYYPLSEIDRYPTPPAAIEQLPVTALGKIVEEVFGIKVSTINRALRGGATVLLQLCIGLGLLLVLLGRVRVFTPSREFISCAIGCAVAIALHVLLPDVSVEYGLLRTFAQGLFWLAPFMVVGTIQAFTWLSRPAYMRIAVGIAITFFLSLTGVISQMLGGYPPQLHLNNSGQYYDSFYTHPQELAAVSWLQSRNTTEGVQTADVEVATDKFVLMRIGSYSDVEASLDVFPAYLQKEMYALQGYANIKKGESTAPISGDLVPYKYPQQFLDKNKNLIFSSEGVRIYK